MIHRWLGHKNVSAHRALWEACYGEEPHGYPRRLDECAYEMCVSPRCFTVATPLEPANLPESMTRGQRIDLDGEPIKDYKVQAGALVGAPNFQEVYIFRANTLNNELLKLACKDGGHQIVVPTCPNGHPIYRWMDDWAQHIGERFRCQMCSRIMRFIKSVRGWQPRPSFRPMTGARLSLAAQTQQMMDGLPHANKDDPWGDEELSDEEFAAQTLAQLREIEERQDNQPDE
jgi:hypothetical protein